MEQHSFKLLLRQVKDIQAQADKIVQGENSADAMETFARYSAELKNYISVNIQSAEIKAFLTELSDVNYSRMKIRLWQYLLLPYWWIGLYKDYQARNKTVEEINTLRGKYATLELLIRALN